MIQMIYDWFLSEDKTGGEADVINLYVHTISDLWASDFPTTNNSFKHKYDTTAYKDTEYKFETCTASTIVIVVIVNGKKNGNFLFIIYNNNWNEAQRIIM